MVTTIMRGTTPTVIFTFRVVDPTTLKEAFLTIRQGKNLIVERDISSASIKFSEITWRLTQEETLRIPPYSELGIHLRWKTVNGVAGGSAVYRALGTDILQDGVI